MIIRETFKRNNLKRENFFLRASIMIMQGATSGAVYLASVYVENIGPKCLFVKSLYPSLVLVHSDGPRLIDRKCEKRTATICDIVQLPFICGTYRSKPRCGNEDGGSCNAMREHPRHRVGVEKLFLNMDVEGKRREVRKRKQGRNYETRERKESMI